MIMDRMERKFVNARPIGAMRQLLRALVMRTMQSLSVSSVSLTREVSRRCWRTFVVANGTVSTQRTPRRSCPRFWGNNPGNNVLVQRMHRRLPMYRCDTVGGVCMMHWSGLGSINSLPGGYLGNDSLDSVYPTMGWIRYTQERWW